MTKEKNRDSKLIQENIRFLMTDKMKRDSEWTEKMNRDFIELFAIARQPIDESTVTCLSITSRAGLHCIDFLFT